MAFKTSESVFRSIFGEGKAEKTLIDKFFYQLSTYLSQLGNDYQEAQKLADWIKNGNEMMCFECRADVVDEISDYFKDNAIPFIAITEPSGHLGYIIRACDEKKAGEARDAVLEERAKHCTILTMTELKDKISGLKTKDKNILYISDLTAEEADILREYCEQELNDNDIGIDEMEDGKYTFSFIGKKALQTKRRGDKNLPFVVLEAMMAAYGPNSAKVLRKARNHIALENAIGKRFKQEGINLNRTPAWVVCRDNQYMRIDETGFEYGRAVFENGDLNFKEEFTADVSMPDYDAQMNSYLMRMRDAAYTYNITDAYQHLCYPEESTLVERTTSADKIIRKFEHTLAQQIMISTERKCMNEPIMQMNERWDEKFNNIMRNASFFMTCAMEPEKIKQEIHDEMRKAEFSDSQIINIVQVLDEYGGMEMRDYQNAIDRIEDFETYSDKPTFDRINHYELDNKLHQRGNREEKDNRDYPRSRLKTEKEKVL